MAQLLVPVIYGSVREAFNDDGEPADPNMHSRTSEFFDEFTWYMKALGEARKRGVPY